MRFYTKTHKYYCGIDLHTKNLYVCLIDHEGEILVPKNIKTHPEALMKLIKPYRDELVIGVECMFSGYWIADFGEDNGIDFVLGHTLYMRAIHGGKAKNDRIDSLKIATLRRGGLFPLAYVYPRAMRPTRDLIRRRLHRRRKRAEWLAPIQNTNSQYNLPEIGKNLCSGFNREGIAERFEHPSSQKSIQLDLNLIGFYDEPLSKIEWHINRYAKEVDYRSVMLLRSAPGIGQILSLVILYEIHDIDRFPRVQDFISYGRLVKCKKESAGKSSGTSGAKIGNAYFKWAFSEAAVLFLRQNPEGQVWLEKLANRHNKAKALSILAQKRGRAVYFMLKRNTVFDQKRFLNA